MAFIDFFLKISSDAHIFGLGKSEFLQKRKRTIISDWGQKYKLWTFNFASFEICVRFSLQFWHFGSSVDLRYNAPHSVNSFFLPETGHVILKWYQHQYHP